MTINTAELAEAVDTECANEPIAVCKHPPLALDLLHPSEILERLPDVSDWSDLTRKSRHAYRKGAIRILDWLTRFEGDGWQARWEAANGNATVWIDQLVDQDPRAASTSRTELVGGLRFLLFLRVFRPSYGFFHSYRASQFYDCAQRTLNPDMFARLDSLGHTLGMPDQQIIDGKRTLVRIMLHTGAALDEITENDFIELRDYYHLNRSEYIPHGASQAWDMLGAAGSSHPQERCSPPCDAKDNFPLQPWWIPTGCAASRYGMCLSAISIVAVLAWTTPRSAGWSPPW